MLSAMQQIPINARVRVRGIYGLESAVSLSCTLQRSRVPLTCSRESHNCFLVRVLHAHFAREGDITVSGTVPAADCHVAEN